VTALQLVGYVYAKKSTTTASVDTAYLLPLWQKPRSGTVSQYPAFRKNDSQRLENELVYICVSVVGGERILRTTGFRIGVNLRRGIGQHEPKPIHCVHVEYIKSYIRERDTCTTAEERSELACVRI
jgi:hypothetical protein